MYRLYKDTPVSPKIAVLGLSELMILIARSCGIDKMSFPLRFLLAVSVFMFFIMEGYELKEHRKAENFLIDFLRDSLSMLLPLAVALWLVRSDLIFKDHKVYLLWLLLGFYAVRAVYAVISGLLLLLRVKRYRSIAAPVMMLTGIVGTALELSGFRAPLRADIILMLFLPAATGLLVRCFLDRYAVSLPLRVIAVTGMAVLFAAAIVTGTFADPVHRRYPAAAIGIIVSIGSAWFLIWAAQYMLKIGVLRDICITLANHPAALLVFARLDTFVMRLWGSDYPVYVTFLRTVSDLAFVLMLSLMVDRVRPTEITQTDRTLCLKYTRAANIYFYIAFTCLIIRSSLNQTMIISSFPQGVARNLVYMPTVAMAYTMPIVFLIALVSVRNTVQYYAELGIFIYLSIWFHYRSDQFIYFALILMLAATGKNFKKILKIYFVVVLAVLVAAWWTSREGYVTNLIFYRDKINLTGPRYALGTTYVTDLAAHWFYLVTLICIAVPKKRGWQYFIIYPVLFYVAGYIYHITNTRLDAIVTFAVILIMLLSHIRRFIHLGKIYAKIAAAVGYIFSLSYILCMLLSFYMVANYNMETMDMPFENVLGKFMDLYNLKQRFRISKTALQKYPLTLLGNSNRYTEVGEGGKFRQQNTITFLDISYIKIPYMYGLIIAAIFLIIWTIIIFRQARQHHLSAVLILSVVAFTGFIEHHLAEYYYNIFTLAMFTADTGLMHNISKKRRTR